MSSDALSGIYGGGGTLLGIIVTWALTRRDHDHDQDQARRAAWEKRIEEKLDALDEKLSHQESRMAGLSAIVDYFVPKRRGLFGSDDP